MSKTLLVVVTLVLVSSVAAQYDLNKTSCCCSLQKPQDQRQIWDFGNDYERIFAFLLSKMSSVQTFIEALSHLADDIRNAVLVQIRKLTAFHRKYGPIYAKDIITPRHIKFCYDHYNRMTRGRLLATNTFSKGFFYPSLVGSQLAAVKEPITQVTYQTFARLLKVNNPQVGPDGSMFFFMVDPQVAFKSLMDQTMGFYCRMGYRAQIMASRQQFIDKPSTFVNFLLKIVFPQENDLGRAILVRWIAEILHGVNGLQQIDDSSCETICNQNC